MARKEDVWFEFNGKKSTDMGVRFADAHTFSRGEARGTQEKVSGGDGYVWISGDAFEAFEIKCACYTTAEYLRAASVWLNGSGRLRFSAEETAAYDARIIKKIDYKLVAPAIDPKDALYKFTITFSCQPFARIYPEALPEEIDIYDEEHRPTPFQDIINPGTVPSLPRITIEGSGSFTVGIGTQQIYFHDVTDGIIVDSELLDAIELDGSALANGKMEGEFFEIPVGTSEVNWEEGGENDEGEPVPGSLTKITIEPRWRCL